MARLGRNKDSWHSLTIKTDRDDGELILVGTGRYAYLWAGRNPESGQGCVTISGIKTLRKLANAILRETAQR